MAARSSSARRGRRGTPSRPSLRKPGIRDDGRGRAYRRSEVRERSLVIRRRGLVTAASAAGLALAVLATSAVVSRDRLLEAWYAWRFESDDPAEKDRAADALASLGSPLAAKYLYQKVRSQLEDRSVSLSSRDPVQLLNHWSARTGIELTLDPTVDAGSIQLGHLGGGLRAV